MADQGKWFKLWNSAIEDADLENLELEDWARWAKLGAYIKAHGNAGQVDFPYPYRKLLNMFRVQTIEAAKAVIKLFPNVHVGEREVTVTPVTPATVTLQIEYTNWFKYQSDFSGDRVRKFRDKKHHRVTPQEEKRRDKEEKRIEIPPMAPQGAPSKILSWFETTWKAYPAERRTGKKAALRSYRLVVKVHDDALWVARALDKYLKSKTVQDGYVKNASTFFANVEDYADERRNSAGSTGQVVGSGQAAEVSGNGIAPAVRAVVGTLGNSIAPSDPKNGVHR